MRYFWVALLVIFVSGCATPEAAREVVKDKHAQLYVYVKRLNNPDTAKRPTQAETEAMLKASLKDMESLDALLNNWKADSAMPNVTIEGKDTNAP